MTKGVVGSNPAAPFFVHFPELFGKNGGLDKNCNLCYTGNWEIG